MTPGEVEKAQARHDEMDRHPHNLGTRTPHDWVGQAGIQAHVDRAALLADRTRLEALVRELRGALTEKGYHAPNQGGRCIHGMSRWMGSHCAFDCAALIPDATPEGEGGQG